MNNNECILSISLLNIWLHLFKTRITFSIFQHKQNHQMQY